ncbi:MAG: hypothetical protein A3C50_02950 [Candidatus Staskawiczbacteria bacterium RIFCSPHIGHO2_02_FULL_43_16]|uniref:Uncharacterized protein n=1 Tax=Candidatus Staskawiczbacteria bacterium RIFCSPHIGHO2_01_FULL_41_41 TaxID=1802203 RepID=A0A1G2HRU7_9BACT|nr:MAG: hypothetical protein A2822_01145 [Candidatus Staskawiczbacteria bacterium RIFCSPHIGHO2_01_FULL_41_41]OGZ68573.1 MAG: hypothetical protein A3C50_02950 [Candidatus Staskawiczbacteria bacterium RIFCSPHIGHO2_02_FULL_43_16]
MLFGQADVTDVGDDFRMHGEQAIRVLALNDLLDGFAAPAVGRHDHAGSLLLNAGESLRCDSLEFRQLRFGDDDGRFALAFEASALGARFFFLGPNRLAPGEVVHLVDGDGRIRILPIPALITGLDDVLHIAIQFEKLSTDLAGHFVDPGSVRNSGGVLSRFELNQLAGRHTPETTVAAVRTPAIGIVMPTAGPNFEQVTIPPLHDHVIDGTGEGRQIRNDLLDERKLAHHLIELLAIHVGLLFPTREIKVLLPLSKHRLARGQIDVSYRGKNIFTLYTSIIA